MRVSNRGAVLRRLCGAVLAVQLCWAVGVGSAQTDPPKKAPDKADPKAADKSEPAPKLPAKKLEFSMSEKPWNLVFAWLSEQTNKPLITAYKPAGSFTFL